MVLLIFLLDSMVFPAAWKISKGEIKSNLGWGEGERKSCLRADNRIAGLRHFPIVLCFFCILGYKRGGLEVFLENEFFLDQEEIQHHFDLVLCFLVTGSICLPGGPYTGKIHPQWVHR